MNPAYAIRAGGGPADSNPEVVMRALLLAAVGVVLVAGAVRADEEKIALDKLPKAVADAVKKRFPKAELLEAAKETDKDKVEYEVTLKDGETHIDVMLTPEGAITLIEKTMPAKDLPKAVTDGIEAKHPKAVIKTAEELIGVKDGKETLDFYEVIVTTADKKTLELKLSPDGKITNTEDKTDEKEEKKPEKKEDKKDEPKKDDKKGGK